MDNIVKLYNDKNYDTINRHLLSNPNMFTNKKFIYIRANTEYKLKNYVDSYISFSTLLNNYDLDYQQYNITKDQSFNCLKLINNNNECKIDYRNIVQMPKNFKWIIHGILCTMSVSRDEKYMNALRFYNVKYMINLKDNIDNIDKNILEKYNIICINSVVPIIEHIDKFIDLVNECKIKKDGILINYDDDTGVMLACYFLKEDKNFPQLSPTDAIKKIKKIIPNSINTKQQENIIHKYSNILWQRYDDDDKSNIKNYPSIYHLSFSDSINNDINITDMTKLNFLNENIVIIKLINGINCYTKTGKMYEKTNNEKFNIINDPYILLENIPDNFWLFGKNIMNEFFLLSIYNSNTKIWLSWKDTKIFATEHSLHIFPELYIGKITDYNVLKKWKKVKNNYIVRTANEFENKNFNRNIAKCITSSVILSH